MFQAHSLCCALFFVYWIGCFQPSVGANDDSPLRFEIECMSLQRTDQLPFHHLPYAHDASVADQFDHVNARGVLRQIDYGRYVRNGYNLQLFAIHVNFVTFLMTQIH